MIKLTSKSKRKNVSFYFLNMEDCNKFKYVFRNYLTGVHWKDPKIIPDDTPLSDYNKRYLGKPEELAENNLKWAHNALNSPEYEELNKRREKVFVSAFIRDNLGLKE